MTVERIFPPTLADERTMLRSHLDFHRRTLELTCAGLNDVPSRIRSVAPSTLSLPGLARHPAGVERAWSCRVVDAEHDLPLVWSENAGFKAAYETQGRKGVRGFHRPGGPGPSTLGVAKGPPAPSSRRCAEHRRGVDVPLRRVMLHMIHEYARHNGHAGFLRESIDGTTGV
ncbi:DUF664 domain-containing protein [Streptomyces sp. NPDC059861]|uniref:mycothiol transferase n=1 Tax=Streptomyces sp. NPDC059861 TaxID=3346974 RepID=UPI0036497ADF